MGTVGSCSEMSSHAKTGRGSSVYRDAACKEPTGRRCVEEPPRKMSPCVQKRERQGKTDTTHGCEWLTGRLQVGLSGCRPSAPRAEVRL